MIATEAKAIIRRELEQRRLPYTKLTAKTVDFTDLARTKRLFVKIHGWQPNLQFEDLRLVAKQHGFCVEA